MWEAALFGVFERFTCAIPVQNQLNQLSFHSQKMLMKLFKLFF